MCGRALLLLLLFIFPLLAEEEEETQAEFEQKELPAILDQGVVPPNPTPPHADDEVYRVQSGDVLSISIYGEKRSKSAVTVGASGTLNYLFVQNLPALGKTIPEIKAELSKKLEKYYKYPLVIATPVQFASQFYTIIGELNDPGRKPLLGNSTLIGALCEARGFRTRIFRNQTVDLVDYDHSFLSRNGNLVPIDFRRLIVDGDLSQDVRLKSGDYIYIAAQDTLKVFVVGEVYRPVTVNYLTQLTLADALAEGGGLTLRASSRALVIRGSIACPKWFLIDTNRILKGYACDFLLEPGDIVYVPPMQFTNLKEYIQGGISAFVSIVANVAGTNAFLEIYPKAKGANVISPVPVFNAAPTTQVIVPVTPGP